jgi:hypothetical protein
VIEKNHVLFWSVGAFETFDGTGPDSNGTESDPGHAVLRLCPCFRH